MSTTLADRAAQVVHHAPTPHAARPVAARLAAARAGWSTPMPVQPPGRAGRRIAKALAAAERSAEQARTLTVLRNARSTTRSSRAAAREQARAIRRAEKARRLLDRRLGDAELEFELGRARSRRHTGRQPVRGRGILVLALLAVGAAVAAAVVRMLRSTQDEAMPVAVRPPVTAPDGSADFVGIVGSVESAGAARAAGTVGTAADADAVEGRRLVDAAETGETGEAAGDPDETRSGRRRRDHGIPAPGEIRNPREIRRDVSGAGTTPGSGDVSGTQKRKDAGAPRVGGTSGRPAGGPPGGAAGGAPGASTPGASTPGASTAGPAGGDPGAGAGRGREPSGADPAPGRKSRQPAPGRGRRSGRSGSAG
jgi:hypothetical protein